MISLARALWRLPHAPGAPRRVWRDWMLVAVVASLTLFEAAVRSDVQWIWPSLAVQFVLIAALLWRRTHPGLMVVIVFGSSTLLDVVRLLAGLPPADIYASAFALILFYALTRWGSGRELIAGGVVILSAMVRPFALSAISPADLIGGAAVLAIPITLGAVIRYRDSVRIERLEQVRLHERERLARDLHDTVAHHVSAIALRAQAGIATAAADPASAESALQAIQTEASTTLREMRSLVGVLRDEADLRSPVVGAAELRALGSWAGGAAFTLDVEGDLEGVPAPTVAALYRIVQEAVTNARRHAISATLIDVQVTVGEQQVAVRIHDDGQGSGRGAEGFGIRGMVERADLLGGVCTAAADDAGGWTVTATLPIARSLS